MTNGIQQATEDSCTVQDMHNTQIGASPLSCQFSQARLLPHHLEFAGGESGPTYPCTQFEDAAGQLTRQDIA